MKKTIHVLTCFASLASLIGLGLGGCNGGESASTTNAASGGQASGGGAEPSHPSEAAKACVETCTQPSDCAVAGEALYDASHFSCTSGRCQWLGCKTNSECTAALGTSTATCATAPGSTIPDCLQGCTTSADCVEGTSALYDKDHFACTGGLCQWLGCKSNDECTSALHSAKFACSKPAGADVAGCQETCTKAADCAVAGSTLYDASHFTCAAGMCEWTGCKSASECKTSLMASNFTCE